MVTSGDGDERGRRPERATANDVMHLAYDSPSAPAQVGALLVLAPPAPGSDPVDLDLVRRTFAARIRAVPRLRQVLRRLPIGAGRPIWEDAVGFDVRDHVTTTTCPEPGSLAALRDLAASIATVPLAPARPLWSATLVTGVTGGRSALVVVVHHALADGVSALGLLRLLVDGAPVVPDDHAFPRRSPSRWRLTAEATADKARAALAVVRGLPHLVRAAGELRLARLAPAPRCSLNRRIGHRRRLSVVSVPVAPVRAAARALGGSVNDAVLTAATGALRSLLADRGETVAKLAVAVFVAANRLPDPAAPRNHVGVLPLTLPTGGEPRDRLRRVSEITGGRLRRIAAASRRSGSRGADSEERQTSAVLLEPLFRLAGALRLTGWYFARQRRVNTFVTSLRGPARTVRLCGTPVTDIIPMSNISGNIVVVFVALTYADTLTISILADPDSCPDSDQLTGHLERELRAIAASAPTPC